MVRRLPEQNSGSFAMMLGCSSDLYQAHGRLAVIKKADFAIKVAMVENKILGFLQQAEVQHCT